MGENYFAKLIYFIVLIVLAVFMIPAFSYYKLGWLAVYLLLGIVCFSGAFALSLFFILNIIIAFVFYMKSGSIIYLELLLVMIIALIASFSNVKGRKQHAHPTPEVPKSEQISKELSGSGSETPKVEVYGETKKEPEKKAKTNKKAAGSRTGRVKKKASKTKKKKKRPAKKKGPTKKRKTAKKRAGKKSAGKRKTAKKKGKTAKGKIAKKKTRKKKRR